MATIGEKEIKTDWPIEEPKFRNIPPEEGSFVPRRLKEGL